ncbi:MAG: Mannose-1-phosphate guanylyltransferase [bacterium]|nr:Mannose-1-phosphate guanylyltransferase [bacterium]
MQTNSWALIMAGGGGTRLWPASRRHRPKQFLPLLPGGRTLLEATVERLTIPIERILVVTAASQVADVERTIPGLPRSNIVVDPQARNTAACIGLGALEILRRDADAVMAVVPSDQHVTQLEPFRASVQQALDRARRGVVVTIGIRPTHPETGYGYIEMGEEEGANTACRQDRHFSPMTFHDADLDAGTAHALPTGMCGYITEADFMECEEAFPGIVAFYARLEPKPQTFLELVHAFVQAVDDRARARRTVARPFARR